MSRKAPTFGQLADYIARGSNAQSSAAFVRNLYSDGQNRSEVVSQYLDNYRYLPERKGGNALYHEVVVLEPQPHLAPEAVEAALHDLAERYCAQRAPHQMAWGHVHSDTEFPHIHLMISANAVRSDRRVRMDRAYFARVQRDLERWQDEHLPEIRGRRVYDRQAEKETPRQPNQEGEMVRRTKEPSKKQVVYERLQAILAGASGLREAQSKASNLGLEFYQRGQTLGVQDVQTGKRYRLQTLGLATAFEKVMAVPEKEARPKVDDRELDLLQRRMNSQAKQQLRDFDRDDDSSR